MQTPCYAAIHRYCVSQGHATGFGPAEIGPDTMQIACLDGVAQVRHTLFTDMVAIHNGCNQGRPAGNDCNAAIKRWCIQEGFVSGFGPLEHSGDNLVVACVRR